VKETSALIEPIEVKIAGLLFDTLASIVAQA
jgi:hypothetical protein